MTGGALPGGLRFPTPVKEVLILVGVNVVSMDSPRVIPRQSVVIDDGMVRAIGPVDQLRTWEGRRLDCRDKYLLPGLADMHVHCWELTDLALYLANGVTTIRNMRGASLHLALRDRIARRELPGPRLVTTTPLIDGIGENGLTTRPESMLLMDPAAAHLLVERLHRRGYEQIKAYQRLRLDVLTALGRAARDAGLRMTGHCPDGVTCEEAIEAGMSCFEHLTWLPAGSDDQVRRLAEHLAATRVWNCPTVVVSSAAARARDADADLLSLLRYQPRQIARRWSYLLQARLEHATGRGMGDGNDLARRETTRSIDTIAVLHSSGAPLLLGTDARNPYVMPGFAVHDELAHLVDAGLTPYQALRCATVEAAAFLGEDDISGTVAVGKRADLVIADRNPLTDLSTLRRPHGVLVNGFFLDQANLKDLLVQREAWARQAEVLPPVALPPVSGPSVGEFELAVVAEGELTETRFGAPVARTAYRHSRADRDWIVEEERVEAPSGVKHSIHVRLTAQGVIVDGRRVSTGPIGDERWEYAARSGGGYEVARSEPDGAEGRDLLDEPELVPGEALAASHFLALAAAAGGVEHLEGAALTSLTVDDAGAGVVGLSVTRHRQQVDDDGERTVWSVRTEQPGQPATRVYHLEASGTLIEMDGHGQSSGRAAPVSPSPEP